MSGASIGQAAARHGVPEHVLRHWEDLGVLRPERTGSGHRRYLQEHHSQIELIQCGKAAGLRLDEIRMLLHGSLEERDPVLAHRLNELRRSALEIEASIRMLEHVSTCDPSGECAECGQPHESFGYPPANGPHRA